MTYRREADLTHAVLAALRKLPRVKAWRANCGVRGGIRFGEVGMPDIMAIVGRHGTFVGIETKTQRGTTSPVQDAWHAQAIELGALIVVARTLDEAIDPVVALLAR